GIGRAVALGLAAKGAEVCLTGRKLEALDAVARQAAASALSVRTYPADLTLDQDLDALISQLRHDVERLDLLVHCAGAIAWGPIETASIAEFDRQYRTNVRAPYVLTQAML